MTIFRRLRRKPVGRHADRGLSAALTVVPGAALPVAPMLPVAGGTPLVPHAIRRTAHRPPALALRPLPVPLVMAPQEAPLPVATETAESMSPQTPEQPEGPRVGLFFGDGSHVVIDASDPRAGAFASIAEELNH